LAQLAGQEVDRLLAEADVRPVTAAGEGGPDGMNAERGRRASAVGSSASSAAAAEAAVTAGVEMADVAIDDLFKQIGGGVVSPGSRAAAPSDGLARPRGPAPAKGDPRVAMGAAAGTSEESEEALEESLTARAQQLIDEARREAEPEGISAVGPEAAADRASFEAAAAVAAGARSSADPSPSESRGTAESSVADALAAEMEQDERVHANAVARLAAARDSADAAKQVGGPAGLAVTGVAVVGEDGGENAVGQKPEAGSRQSEIAVDRGATEEAASAGQMTDASGGAGAEVESDDSEPLLVRLLEWLNAPLDGLSDGARAAIGKAAIVTMVNALGVLVYVLIFRR
jgi:hypothetical protein